VTARPTTATDLKKSKQLLRELSHELTPEQNKELEDGFNRQVPHYLQSKV
jgi:hypothetical protein